MDTKSLSELREIDKKYHLHPFTNHTDMHRTGTFVITGAEGVYVIDERGRRLLDGLAGLWCVNVGYGRREIIDAVYQQMQQVAYYPSFFNTTTEPTIRLSECLAKLAPARIKHVTYSNSGSEANESALKIIRNYQKLRGKSRKYKILSRTYAYHGVCIATTSMTGLPTCYQPFDLPLPGFIHVPGPYRYAAQTSMDDITYGNWCVEETERIIRQEGPETIAAMFVEPIQGAGGVIVPPAGYLTALRELCRRHDILFVADEVISGFGRLGDWYASNLWNLDPDLMTLAKGITSGYIPLGATMVSDEIADVLNSGGYIAHGFTYSGHPTATAAALANLDILEKENLIPRTRDIMGPYFQKKLHELADHPAVAEARGYQLIGALELRSRPGTAHSPNTLGAKAAAIAREEGIIVRGIRDLIAVSPPLTITLPEIDLLFSAIGRTLDKLWN